MTARGWVLFCAMCLIWGIPYLLIKVAVGSISPAELVFARTAIGALLLLPLAGLRGQLRPVLSAWRPLLAYTAVEIAVPWLLLSTAEQHISSSLSGLLVAAVPLVGSGIYLARGQGERLQRSRLLGLLLGLLGVMAVLGFELSSLTVAAGIEMAVVIVCYALGPQILAGWLADLPGLGVVSTSLAVCALVYLPWIAVEHHGPLPGPSVLLAVATLGVVCTALAFVLFFHLIAEAGAVRATVITYVNPAVAVALGAAILHEHLSSGSLVGFALILVGSVLAAGRSRPRPGSPAPAPLAVSET